VPSFGQNFWSASYSVPQVLQDLFGFISGGLLEGSFIIRVGKELSGIPHCVRDHFPVELEPRSSTHDIGTAAQATGCAGT
jgi:hypothetical protein